MILINPNLEEKEQLKTTTSFEELTHIALHILERAPQPISQVCGPMTSGGLGSLEKNLAVFEKTVITLKERGEIVFNQLPFEDPMARIKLLKNKGGLNLLETFYRPIFESGFIKRLYFMYGWENSSGSRWEFKTARNLGIEIFYLPPHFHAKLLSAY